MLKDAGKLSEAELAQGTIVSIEQYFNHMGDILKSIEADDARFILLPQDETPFKINGNTRTVTIPSEFVTCGAVKGDTNCEIATFTIDRYFDYTDLANTQVYIQWQNAAGEEGISEIVLKDLSEPGVFRFGWPLTNEITHTAGTVKFAIRFFLKENDAYKYILNTQTASLVVRDTLEINDKLPIETVGLSKFALFVKNSINPAVQTAAAISFSGVGGENLPVVDAIGSDNTLTLKVRGSSKSAATVTYTWYYRPENAVEDPEAEDQFALASTGDWYVISDVYEEISDEEKNDLIPAETYLKYVDGAYVVANIVDDANEVLYKRYNTLTITDTDEEIVGSYWCVVRNSAIDNGGNVDNYREDTSIVCAIQGPHDVDIISDLVEHKFVEDGGEVNLTAGIKNYDNEALTYQWYRSTNINVAPTAVSNQTDDAWNTDVDGWYQVGVVASVNRKSSSEQKSAICRVTHHPQTPVVGDSWYSVGEDGDWEKYTQGIEQKVDGPLGAIYRLKFDVTPSTVDKLLSDKITYKWTVQAVDSNERDITAADIHSNGIIVAAIDGDESVLQSNQITVRCVSNDSLYTYRCYITNELAGESKTIAKEDRPSFIVM